MLGVLLKGRMLTIQQRSGRDTTVQFDAGGSPIAFAVLENNEVLRSWRREKGKSAWKNSQPLNDTDFWATLRSALRVAVGS